MREFCKNISFPHSATKCDDENMFSCMSLPFMLNNVIHKVKLWNAFNMAGESGRQGEKRKIWSSEVKNVLNDNNKKKYFPSDNRRWQIMEHQLWQYHLKCLSDCGREKQTSQWKNNFVRLKSVVESLKGEFYSNSSKQLQSQCTDRKPFMTNRHFCCGKTSLVGLHPGLPKPTDSPKTWFCSS